MKRFCIFIILACIFIPSLSAKGFSLGGILTISDSPARDIDEKEGAANSGEKTEGSQNPNQTQNRTVGNLQNKAEKPSVKMYDLFGMRTGNDFQGKKGGIGVASNFSPTTMGKNLNIQGKKPNFKL